MMNKKTFLILTISMFFVLTFSNIVLAKTGDQIIKGLTNTGKTGGFQPDREGVPQATFAEAFASYVVGLASILSALFLILIIYAGWLRMSAQGNSEKLEKSKKIMIGAVIGLVIIISARLIAELTLQYLGETIPIQDTSPGPSAI